MPKENFLFVPYHAGRYDLAAQKFNASDARSHAAAVSRQRRDNTRLKQQNIQRKSVQPRLAPLEQGRADTSSDDQDDERQTKFPGTKDVLSRDQAATGIVVGKRRQRMRSMQFSWRAGNVSAEIRLSGGLSPKPFGFTDLSQFGQSVMDYYKSVISPVNHPVYAIFNVTNVYTSYWMRLLEDEDYKPAGFAMVGAVMQRVARPGSQPSEDVRLHQATAISRLQKKYNEALKTGRSVADEMVIITVLALASLAKLLGDLRGYETHRKSMKAMIASRGGLDALGHEGLVKCTLLQWDSFWVFDTAGAPLFSDSRPEHIPVYPAFPLSADIRELFVKLPVGFQSLVLKGKISVELIEVLGRAADANEAGIDSLGSGTMYTSKNCKYNDFIGACPFLTVPDSERKTLEKDICLALLLYCSNAFTTARSSAALYISIRMELTRLLLQVERPPITTPEHECLYWICLICIDSWRQNGPSSGLLPKGTELLPVLREIRDSLQTENLLQKFFCYKDLLNAEPRYLEMAG